MIASNEPQLPGDWRTEFVICAHLAAADSIDCRHRGSRVCCYPCADAGFLTDPLRETPRGELCIGAALTRGGFDLSPCRPVSGRKGSRAGKGRRRGWDHPDLATRDDDDPIALTSPPPATPPQPAGGTLSFSSDRDRRQVAVAV